MCIRDSIATLICALFLRHFRKLVEDGHIYVSMPPLYRIDVGKEVFYALDESEKEKMLAGLEKKKPGTKKTVTRFKGLGEMSPGQLRETTMLQESRRLVKLTIDNPSYTEELMDKLMAKKRYTDRKQWLEEKGNLAEL